VDVPDVRVAVQRVDRLVIGEAHLSDEHLDRLVGLGGRRLLISRQLMIQCWTGWGLRLAVSARSIISWTWPSWSMLRRLAAALASRISPGGPTINARFRIFSSAASKTLPLVAARRLRREERRGDLFLSAPRRRPARVAPTGTRPPD
jgi:hypothetical protein